MSKVISFFFLVLVCLTSEGQNLFGEDFSPETRERFVADQEAYFSKLGLSDNQKRAYEEITRRYDKEIESLSWGGIIPKLRKKRLKTLKKLKNKEMKQILASDQYKMYLRRQKEIETKYSQ